MGIREVQRQERIDKIQALLDHGDFSVKEIAKHTGASYHTCRNDLKHLTDKGVVSPTNQYRDGSALYRKGRSRPMVMLYHKASDRNFSMLEVAASFSKNPFETTSSKAALDVPSVAAEICYLVGLHVDKGHPNHLPLATQNSTLRDLRTRLNRDIIYLETVLGMAKQMLADNRLWDPKELELIADDPLFDVPTAIEAQENMLQLRHQARIQQARAQKQEPNPDMS